MRTTRLDPGDLDGEELERLASQLTAPGSTSRDVELRLPARLHRLLADLVAQLQAGNGVAVIPLETELTPNEAAELLNVSRPHLLKILERGDIAHRMVGSHHRVRLDDVLAYKQSLLEQRRAARHELVNDLIDDDEY